MLSIVPWVQMVIGCEACKTAVIESSTASSSVSSGGSRASVAEIEGCGRAIVASMVAQMTGNIQIQCFFVGVRWMVVVSSACFVSNFYCDGHVKSSLMNPTSIN